MAVSRAALSREIAEHPGRPIWAATDTTSGDLICWAWRRLRGSSPVASAVRYSRFGWAYVHWFGHGLRARAAETLLANAWRNCSGRSVVSAGFTRFRWTLWNIGPVVTGPMFHRADGGPVGGRHGGGGCGARDWCCSGVGAMGYTAEPEPPEIPEPAVSTPVALILRPVLLASTGRGAGILPGARAGSLAGDA